MKCPICNGEGRLLEDCIDYNEIGDDCNACKGTGKVSIWWKIQCWFWDTKLAEWIYHL
jgi:DnaJ-class molecular chaperone